MPPGAPVNPLRGPGRIILELCFLISRACRKCTCGACEEIEPFVYELVIDAPPPEKKGQRRSRSGTQETSEIE